MKNARKVEGRAVNSNSELVIDVELQLRGSLAATLEAEAKKRGTAPCTLLASIINIVIADNLFTAVLE